MAEMVPGHTGNPALRELAARIRAAQKPEIATLQGWLQRWNTVPSGSGHSPGAGGSVRHGMAGMMHHEDMVAPKEARGAAFDERWLRMMIEHHRGAIDMAREELETGRHALARKLAQEIIAAQKAEIAQMRGMLDKP